MNHQHHFIYLSIEKQAKGNAITTYIA